MADIEIRAFGRRLLLVLSKYSAEQASAPPDPPVITFHHSGHFGEGGFWRDDHAVDLRFGFNPKNGEGQC